jgi:hypothetical protein
MKIYRSRVGAEGVCVFQTAKISVACIGSGAHRRPDLELNLDGRSWNALGAGMLLRPLLLCILSCVALAMSAFGQALPPGITLPPGTTMHRFQAGEPDASGWMLATSTEGAFSVRMPIKFNDFTIDESNPSAPTLRLFSVGATSQEKIKFVATRVVYRKGAESAQFFFSRAEKGEGLTALERVTPRRIGERRAVDHVLKRASDVAYQRTILLETDLLMMIIESPRSLDATAQQFVAPFFDSLTTSAK